MNKPPLEHVEEQHISAMDTIVYAIKKRNATPAEIAALLAVVMALVKVHEL